MSAHRGTNLRIARLRRLRQQFRSLHDHPVVAVSALDRLLIDHGLLHGMQGGRPRQLLLRGVPGGKSFERRDRLALHGGDRRHARSRFNPVDEDRTRSALTQAATKPRPLKVELVHQDVQKRRVGPGGYRPQPFVHFELEFGHFLRLWRQILPHFSMAGRARAVPAGRRRSRGPHSKP